MSGTISTQVSFSGFQEFVLNYMKIPDSDENGVPQTSLALVYAYQTALQIVNQQLACVSASLYMLAVYNLAGSFLLNYGVDTPPSTYLADARKNLGLDVFTLGLADSASDQGTSGSLAVPDFYKKLSLADLQMLKDPYGRAYMGIAMRMGSLWGYT